MTCSLSLLLVFAAAVLYLNENYTAISISPIISLMTPSFSTTSTPTTSVTYLHPLAYHSLAYGTCPYTNPTFPSIGPMRAGVVWYLEEHVRRNEDLNLFFKQYEALKEVVRYNTNSSDQLQFKALEITFKKAAGLHLTYQYISCQTEQDMVTMYKHWKDIIKTHAWKEVEVCFDRVLCMNDNPHGGYAFNLYLDDRSQHLMQRFVAKTEEIVEKEYAVDLTYKRVEHQQAFHVTLVQITNMEDYDVFDAKRLMERINEEFQSWPCIRLGVAPPFKNEMCSNTMTLQERHPKFHWKCTTIQ